MTMNSTSSNKIDDVAAARVCYRVKELLRKVGAFDQPLAGWTLIII